MQITLLGASGFVGRAVLERLLGTHDVRTVCRSEPATTAGWLQLDLVDQGSAKATSQSSAKVSDSGSALEFAQSALGSAQSALVSAQAALDSALAAHLDDSEVLVDAAALTGYAADPPDDLASLMRVNLGIPMRVARVLPASVRRIVYLSTIDVYAPPKRHPLTEASPTEPITSYARTKRLAEHAYAQLAAERRIDLVILRLSQVYGPGDPSPKLVPTFMRSALLEGRIPQLSGTGNELRDLVHVDDVATCVELALEGPAGTYNLATGKSCQVREVARVLAVLAGLPEGGADGRPTGKPDSMVDIGKARRDLGFAPAITLEQGLMRTLEWMRGQPSN